MGRISSTKVSLMPRQIDVKNILFNAHLWLTALTERRTGWWHLIAYDIGILNLPVISTSHKDILDMIENYHYSKSCK